MGNGGFIAFDHAHLVAHPLAHLLGAVGTTPSAPDELDGLFALACKAVGEQAYDTMLREHRLGRALQRRLLDDLAFTTSYGRGQCQQRRLGVVQAFFQVTTLRFHVGVGTHHQHAFLPAEPFIDTRSAHFVALGQHLLLIVGQHLR